MNIAICFDKNFQKWATVCLYSIWEQHKKNPQPIRLVILSDTTYNQCKWQLKKVLKHFDFSFDNPGHDFDSMPTGYHFKTAVYWRLKLPSVLSKYDIKKSLYLDLDILVLGNLQELYNQDLNGKVLGAVKDIGSYENVKRMNLQQGFAVNSGVLLMDVMRMCEYDWIYEAARLNQEGRIQWVDQDVINIVLDGKVEMIDLKWNVQSGNFQNGYKEEVSIVHFTESNNTKPWNIKSKHLYMGVYNTYMRKSGFYFEYAWFELIRRIIKLSFLI